METVSPERLAAAASRLPGVPRVVASGNAAAPLPLLRAIDAALPRWRLHMLNAPPGIPARDGVRLETAFVGTGMRDRPELDYIPSRLSLVPPLFRDQRPPDVVVLHTSTPRNGHLSMGCEVNVLPAAVEAVRARGGLVVAQVNPRMPYTFGDGELHVDDVDLAVEVDEPLPAPAPREPDECSREIADRVAALVREGATLQMGIGAVPDATLAAVRHQRGLRVWSEMFSDGVLELERRGALDDATPITASFLAGSAELMAWVDRNPRVRMLRTERANDPGRIARQPHMTSVNTAMQVDLYAQANASYRRGRIYSGFGGQTDFIVGALHSPGGRAIVALASWHAASDTSTIVPRLEQPSTSFQHSHVVTEHGAATIWGCTDREQAAQLVGVAAHPRARESLRAAAAERGLV
ncbi:MAG TPA: acetyl-CoA hydrolase/transferase C-terminal domain-containing protein [Mycobacteriales bacterium]|jgi:acyl-CoA hydrolase|nr:acetyl-CoA hydrolase/transferase C-terminal domain-containing protein [Mycobacteriales bacterium]